MIKEFVGEEWKVVRFDFEYTNKLIIEVSNYGRVRSTTQLNGMQLLKGNFIDGYRAIRLRFFKDHEPEIKEKIDAFRLQIAQMNAEVNAVKKQNKAEGGNVKLERQIKKLLAALEQLKKNYSKFLKQSNKKRTINKNVLVHRLVAEYFLEKPTPNHTLIAHLDYEKLNNKFNNLVWMTREENNLHQRKSPYVIEAMEARLTNRNENGKNYKLTTPKVMLIKKKIGQGVRLRTLAKSFDVTETQLLRIKRGENWVNVESA